MTRKVTLGMLEREAAKLGASVEEVRYRDLDCTVEAPAGKVWADGDLHVLVGTADPDKASSWAMRADLLNRMAFGLTDCPAPDCELCAERRNVNLED